MSKFKKTEHCEAHGVPALKPVLAEWIAVQREYTRQTGGDYSRYYRERALTGFLAAAAWRAGGVALEEWSTEKKGPRNEPHKGRCDLYICRRKRSFHIEAKHMWSRVAGNQAKQLERVQRNLDRAVTDAKALQCPRKEKLGVLFIAPYIPPRKQTDMTSKVAEWLESIYEIPHSAIAWLFLDRHKLKPDRRYNFTPGIVLIVHSLTQRA
jgi:hypothetical protein